ncbi:MAG: hypothetical protein ACFFDS_09630 [Candidatus Thorarchaeota archaeon]
MSFSPIIEEVAKKLKCKPEDIRFKKDLDGTSTARVSEVTWGKDKIGILKQNTNKIEWLFYSKIAKNYKVPAPSPIAVSTSSDIPWILIEKIYRGIHPKKWEKNNIERALKELARFHAQFFNREEEKEFEQFPKLFTKEWDKTKDKLIKDLNKAIKIATQYKGKTPVTKTEFEQIKKKIKQEKFLNDILSVGTTLLHGATWCYNFMQSAKCSCLLDWKECFFGPPSLEILHFYDLLHFNVEGIKINLRSLPVTLDGLIKLYLSELKKKNITIKTSDFKETVKATVPFHFARQWAPILKPDVIYLHGGRYFVARTLRLLPSRKDIRQHYKDLLAYSH